MADHPLESVLVNAQDVNKGALKIDLKKFTYDSGTVVQFRTYSLPGVTTAIAGSKFWYYDVADLVTADDGLTCIHDADGRRFKNALGYVLGQFPFPATQNPSADPNTLDDYEEGTWTPAITFATAGNIAVAYTAQAGTYTKIGNRVLWAARLLTSSFTHTTAAGNFRLSGFPFAATSGQRGAASCIMSGYTLANYDQVAIEIQNGQNYAEFLAGGSGQSLEYLNKDHVPSAGTINIYASGQYQV
jgi:hypothetical protein